MNEEILKACACGARPLAKPLNENQWHIHCINPECKTRPGSIATTYKLAASMWNNSAGDRQPAVSKTPEPSTLASATCSLADERSLSDLLAAALVGEYPAEAALKRYCATLASPFDVQVVMAKFRSKPANGKLRRGETD